MFKHIIISVVLLLNSCIFAFSQEPEELTWPREIETAEKAVITLYQPQLESFKSNILIGRMAISVKPVDKGLIFGAIWFSAKLTTDIENRIAVLDDLDITQTHFPEIEEDKVVHFARMLEAEVEGWDVEMSLDRILASLEVAEEDNILTF